MNQVIVFPGFYSAIVVRDPSEYSDAASSPGLIPPSLVKRAFFFWKKAVLLTPRGI